MSTQANSGGRERDDGTRRPSDDPIRAVTDFVARLGRSMGLGLRRLFAGQDLTYASSIAYYTLLSLFPFLLVAFSVLGFVTSDVEDRRRIADLILRYFPRQFTFLTSQLDAIRSTPLTLGLAGTAGLVWAALGVFGAIRNAVNRAWGTTKSRGFIGHHVAALIMLIAAAGLLALVVLLAGAASVVETTWFASLLGQVPGSRFAGDLLTGLTVRFALPLLLTVVVALVLYFVPETDVRVRDILPGAVLTALLLQGALRAFAWYASDITRYTRIHGSIAGVVVFMTWIYLSAVILLYGVEVTAVYSRLRAEEDAGRKAA